MKKILIHHNNTSFNQDKYFSLSDQFTFDIPNDTSDIDVFIDKEVRKGRLGELIRSADILFIKISLSDNYLEYTGLRLAYHIRLTKQLADKSLLPIVFIGEESYQFLGITASEPSILFTDSIYLIPERDESFRKALRWYKEGIIKPLSSLNNFITKITIQAPANHVSHHSIANEWSILRWAEILGIDKNEEELKYLKQNIESQLYYKFLQFKFSSASEQLKERFKIDGQGKILYIDDEWDKGWSSVLKNLFVNVPGISKEFQAFENTFKDQSQESIMDRCKDKIKTEDPDIVILDLRLTDSDFNANYETHQLSGFKVLQIVKKINPGIRVIVFTASNKVWNFIELQQAGANGFILKESPELSIMEGNTKEVINRFVLTIEEQLKYKFCKSLFNSIFVIRKNLKIDLDDSGPEYKDFITGLKKQIKVIYASVCKIDIRSSITLDMVFLSCYNFLELYKDYYLHEDEHYRMHLGNEEIPLKKYYIKDNEAIGNEFVRNAQHESPSTYNALAALFIDYFKVSESPYDEVKDLNKISKLRNEYIHGNKHCFHTDELELIMRALRAATQNLKE